MSDQSFGTQLAATNEHYELPPRFFELFLDQRLKYSSGLYLSEDMSLDDAQTAKLEFIAERIGAAPGREVLDIGCGWGSLTLFLASEYGCRVTAVTPSTPQAEFITERARGTAAQGLVHLVRGSIYDVDIDGPKDAVTMVGSVNHMPDQRAVLDKVVSLMRPDAALYLSESCFRSEEAYATFSRRPATTQVTEEIFGFADMVPVSRLIRHMESAGLSIQGLTDLTWHFSRTVADWEAKALAARDEIEQVAPGMAEPLLTYLETTNAAWGYTTKQYAVVAVRNRLGRAEIS